MRRSAVAQLHDRESLCPLVGRRDGGRISVVVDGFEKIRDPIYGELTRRIDGDDRQRWVTQDLGMWVGHSAYLEISDGSSVDFGGPSAQIEAGRGYIAVDEILLSNQRSPAELDPGNADQLCGQPFPQSTWPG